MIRNEQSLLLSSSEFDACIVRGRWQITNHSHSFLPSSVARCVDLTPNSAACCTKFSSTARLKVCCLNYRIYRLLLKLQSASSADFWCAFRCATEDLVLCLLTRLFRWLPNQKRGLKCLTEAVSWAGWMRVIEPWTSIELLFSVQQYEAHLCHQSLQSLQSLQTVNRFFLVLLDAFSSRFFKTNVLFLYSLFSITCFCFFCLARCSFRLFPNFRWDALW